MAKQVVALTDHQKILLNELKEAKDEIVLCNENFKDLNFIEGELANFSNIKSLKFRFIGVEEPTIRIDIANIITDTKFPNTSIEISLDDSVFNSPLECVGEALENSAVKKFAITLNPNTNTFGAEYLLKPLRINKTLTHFEMILNSPNLSWGDLISQSSYINNFLQENTTLKVLRLSKVGFDEEAMQPITEALKSNTTLQEIRFVECNITSEGAKDLAKALKGNTSLQKLDIEGNKIGNDGAKAILEALTGNTTLKHLNLSNNNLTQETPKNIEKELKNDVLEIIWGTKYAADAVLTSDPVIEEASHKIDELTITGETGEGMKEEI